MANLIFGETSFTVRFRIQGNEKQKIHFTNANMNKEKVQMLYYDVWMMDASINSLKILKFTCEEALNYL